MPMSTLRRAQCPEAPQVIRALGAYCHNQYQQRSGEDIAFDFAVRLLREDGHQVSVYSRRNLEIEKFSLADKLLFPLHTIYSR